MLNNLKKRTEGFTIIEVMIVLAIAGLIMVVVFMAIPQLQRNQRNNTRRDIVNRVKAELENYASNNNGVYPTANNNANTGFLTGAGFPTRYLNGVDINDPSAGTAMQLVAWTNDGAVAQGSIYYQLGRRCNGEASQAAAGSRNFIVMTQLEGGARYCADNS